MKMVLILSMLFLTPTICSAQCANGRCATPVRQQLAKSVVDASQLTREKLAEIRLATARVGAISADNKRATSATVIHSTSEGTWLLTVAHGTRDGDKIGVTFADGTQALAERIAANERLDLAVLKVSDGIIRTAVLLAPAAIKRGDVALLSAYSEAGQYRTGWGKVTGYMRMWHNGDDVRYVGLLGIDGVSGKPTRITKAETSCCRVGRRNRSVTRVTVTSRPESFPVPVPATPDVVKLPFDSGLTQLAVTSRAQLGNSGGGVFNRDGQIVAVAWGDPAALYGTNVMSVRRWMRATLTDLSWDMDADRRLMENPTTEDRTLTELDLSPFVDAETVDPIPTDQLAFGGHKPRQLTIDSAQIAAVVTDVIDANPDKFRGEAGPTGLTGPEGPTGLVGPIGPEGVPGESGADADDESILLALFQRIKSDESFRGAKGDAGIAGPVGPVGLTGPVGLIGPTGLQGDKGDKGDTGATGLTGLPGASPDLTGLLAAMDKLSSRLDVLEMADLDIDDLTLQVMKNLPPIHVQNYDVQGRLVDEEFYPYPGPIRLKDRAPSQYTNAVQ